MFAIGVSRARPLFTVHKVLWVFILLTLLSFGQWSYGQNLSSYGPNRRLNDIIIVGLSKTLPHVVKREIPLKKGDSADPMLFEQGIQRLKNLEIFSKVEGKLVRERGGSGVIAFIIIEEKWTLIPIVNFGGDAGTEYYAAGLLDINTGGNYVETGGIYINFGGRHSGLLWFRDRRVGGEREKVGLDIGQFYRTRHLYDSAGETKGVFTHSRIFINAIYTKHINDWLELGGSLEYQRVDANQTGLDIENREINSKNGFSPKESANNIIPWLEMGVGEINNDKERKFGYKTEMRLALPIVLSASDDQYTELHLENTAFWRLPWRSNLGLRLKFARTDLQELKNTYFLGGFEGVRGYRDGRFSGFNYLFGNIEYRIPSVITENFVLQHAVFLDGASISNELHELSGEEREPFHSAGFGVRLISPQIYLLAARLDFVFTFEDKREQSVSFGLLQYF